MLTTQRMVYITALLLTCHLTAVPAELLYIYQEQDGTQWLTNRIMPDDKFVLIQTYGRSTATQSCWGMTPEKLAKRADSYLPIIQHYAKENQLDIFLVQAVIRVESCFDKTAVSRAGAHGLMQLMPATAAQYQVTNRFDPTDNIRAGTQHLRYLLDLFKENLQYALAAYNAGEGAVNKYKGIPPYAETEKYVKNVIKYYEDYSRNHFANGISDKN